MHNKSIDELLDMLSEHTKFTMIIDQTEKFVNLSTYADKTFCKCCGKQVEPTANYSNSYSVMALKLTIIEALKDLGVVD